MSLIVRNGVRRCVDTNRQPVLPGRTYRVVGPNFTEIITVERTKPLIGGYCHDATGGTIEVSPEIEFHRIEDRDPPEGWTPIWETP